MFGYGRKRAREKAARIGRAMIVIRDACRYNDLQILVNVMNSHDYMRFEVDSSDGGPIAAWIEGPLQNPDMVFYVTSDLDVSQKTNFQVLAQGYGKLAGLMLLSGPKDIDVEVSDIRKSIGELGADTLVVQKELLSFPGFSSAEQTLSRLGISKR